MTSKHVAFYITGGIAAYKAAYCVREFVKHGYEVRCAMTKNAAEFVSPLTFETLCKNKVVSDLFDQNNDSHPDDRIPRKSFTSLLEEHIRIILISGKRYQSTELVDPGWPPALQNAFAQFTV